MELLAHFRMLALCNRVANQRLFEACRRLNPVEYRKQRLGSFGSVHGLLNHILLGDRIWMARFDSKGRTAPALNTVLFDGFLDLCSARVEEDTKIEMFFGCLEPEFFLRSVRYTNSQGKEYEEEASVAVSHFFNHQTHHRGQVHVMLSQTPVQPPSLDLHRIINP